MIEMENSIVPEFIDLCTDNFRNGGHSSTEEQEHRYYELKQQILKWQEDSKKFKHDSFLQHNVEVSEQLLKIKDEKIQKLETKLDEIKSRYVYLRDFKGIRKEWHERVVEEFGKILNENSGGSQN